MKGRKFARTTGRAMVLLAATAIVAAACGSDNKASNATTAATQPAVTTPAATTPTATEPAATEPTATDAAATTAAGSGAASLDTNHDGKVVFGIAAAGPVRRRRLLPSGRRRCQATVEGQRLRGSDRGRQHPSSRCRNVDRRPRPAGRRRDHRRCLRDRRAAARPDRQVPRHLLVLQLRRRLPGQPRPGPEPRRRWRDRLHGRLRNRPEAEGEGRRLGGHHRLLRPRLREAGVHVVRARPQGRRSVVHADLRAFRRLPVRLRQHRQRHGGTADGDRQRRRRRLPVPRWSPEAGRASGEHRRHHHDERRLVEGLHRRWRA